MLKEKYLSPIVEVLLLEDDVVRTSNTYEFGDDCSEDIFD